MIWKIKIKPLTQHLQYLSGDSIEINLSISTRSFTQYSIIQWIPSLFITVAKANFLFFFPFIFSLHFTPVLTHNETQFDYQIKLSLIILVLFLWALQKCVFCLHSLSFNCLFILLVVARLGPHCCVLASLAVASAGYSVVVVCGRFIAPTSFVGEHGL